MKISELKRNENNPYPAKDPEVNELRQKIKKYPKFLELRPIIYDPKTMIILGGEQKASGP